VSLDGRVSGLGGSCPNVTFTVRGTTVIASGSTDYKKKDSCRGIRNGRSIEVNGHRWTDGSVRADSIDVAGDDDDDDDEDD
jgi:hypothetical protein